MLGNIFTYSRDFDIGTLRCGHYSAYHRILRPPSGWKLAHHKDRLLLAEVLPATMSPMQSHTQDQDSKALWQRGLAQPMGSFVTLIKPFYPY